MDKPQRPPRKFLPEDFKIDHWDDIKSYFDDLLERKFSSFEDFQKWLYDLSETEAVLEEDVAWRYINMTIDTSNEEAAERYSSFIQHIQPHLAAYSDKLNRKMVESEYKDQLKGEAYFIYLRKIESDIELFREENIPLQSELQQLAQKYSQISGGLNVEVDGEKLTLQKAGAELMKTDREHRKSVYDKITATRLTAKDDLDELFSELIQKRHKLALNAGFENFRDYMFKAMGRFDYSKEDCFEFHNSVSRVFCPIADEIRSKRKKRMGLEKLRPYDMAVDPAGRAPLEPFEGADELVKGSVDIFSEVDKYFGECLDTMNDMGHLDLESKSGKAPGGYNYPLYEIGVPFIFMNAVGTPRDLVVMMHEGGHAVHSFLSRDLELTGFKSCPSEVAELASMSMELLTLEHWDRFYADEESFIRAKQEHLEDILSTLPWIAMIDKFQHRLYENPELSPEERKELWLSIEREFGSDVVDWSGYENALANSWQKQLHLFEVPFYYIEYGMAQLGAIAVWKNFKENPSKAIEQFKSALKLGYTKTIGEIYAEAGIAFDFSESYMAELADFVRSELNKLG